MGIHTLPEKETCKESCHYGFTIVGAKSGVCPFKAGHVKWIRTGQTYSMTNSQQQVAGAPLWLRILLVQALAVPNNFQQSFSVDGMPQTDKNQ